MSLVPDARAEVERLKRMSTVKMMCENQNVYHHVNEWENRCLKAAAEVERLRGEQCPHDYGLAKAALLQSTRVWSPCK